MKKFYFLGLILALFLSFTSCKKDLAPQIVKFQFPTVQLVQSGEMTTKNGSYTGQSLITQLVYEFYVKDATGTQWIPMPASLFTYGSSAYTNHSNKFTLSYPGASGQGFIEMPENVKIRLIIKGISANGEVQFYGGTDYTTTSTPDNHVVNIFEVNSRLNFDVDQLLKLTEYSFDFTIITTPWKIDWSYYLQDGAEWMINNTTGRGWNIVNGVTPLPVMKYKIHVSGDIPVHDANGKGDLVETVTLSINDGTPISLGKSTNSNNVSGEWRNIFTFNSTSSPSISTISTSVTRKHQGTERPQTGTVTNGQPLTGSFNPLNWCQAGYNFNMTVTADQDALATGNYTVNFTLNNEVNGGIHFGN